MCSLGPMFIPAVLVSKKTKLSSVATFGELVKG